MKLTGWYRIGIVLSVLWCFFIIGFTIYQYNSSSGYSFFISWKPDTTKPLPPWEKYKQSETTHTGVFDDLIPTQYEVKKVVNYRNIFLSMIIPVFVGWILVLTSIWTIKWIIRGFKNKEP